MDTLEQRLAEVKLRIAQAAERARRDPAGITLVAVTKVFPAQAIRDAFALGLRDFGENYVQEFAGKLPELAALSGARFHLIGHLQANKSRLAAEMFNCIQPEQAKAGAAPEELADLIEAVRGCPNLRLLGLMTMPPWSDDPERSRPYFRRLRELALLHGLPHLSMGMSHDVETAIEEGSTCVRVGTALFGKRTKP